MSKFPQDKETYFVRLTDDVTIDQATRNRVWASKKIAIHYPWLHATKRIGPDTRSTNHHDYTDPSAKKALRMLNQLAVDGGYVCARHSGQDLFQVGFVHPGSTIEVLKGNWRDAKDHSKSSSRVAILKTLQLDGVRRVKPTSHSALLVARPRQGTIMRWPLAGDAVKNLVNGVQAPPVLDSLNTMQQETMCAEWLRTGHVVYGVEIPRLVHLLLPVGRTMEDFDLVGMTDTGTRILGQVTFAQKGSSTVVEKAKKLQRHHATDVKLVMFCRFEGGIEHVDHVIYIPLERVWTEFTTTETGSRWRDLSL